MSSASDSLGVQHMLALFLGVQQGDVVVASLFAVILVFCITGISEFFVSIFVSVCSLIRTATTRNDAAISKDY